MYRRLRRFALSALWGCVGLFEGSAQSSRANLVPNASFEDHKWCPEDVNRNLLRSLEEWKQPTSGTPDHFDSCGTGPAQVPENGFGNQPAVTGNAYAGIAIYSKDTPDYREYLQVELMRSLAPGEWVCLSMWVCPADVSRYVADGVGMAFSKKRITTSDGGMLALEPAAENPKLHILSNRESWLQLSDAFQAKGGEKFLTIGNFRPPSEVRALEKKDWGPLENDWAYLYIDDVVVESISDSSQCSSSIDRYAAEVTDPPWQTYLTEEIDWRNVLFEFDRSDLTEEGRLQLDTVAHRLLQNRFLVVEVNGHTDIIGDDGYNLELSERRARSVMDYLVSKGVDSHRLRLAWHGFHTPTADNTTEDGRRQNRRVEFTVLEHAFLPAER